jgi:hypothetical protein
MANVYPNSSTSLTVSGYWDAYEDSYGELTVTFPMHRMAPCSLYLVVDISSSNGSGDAYYSIDNGNTWTQLSSGANSISIAAVNGYIYTDRIKIRLRGWAARGIHSTNQVIQEPGTVSVNLSTCYLYGTLTLMPVTEYSAVGTSTRQIWQGDMWYNWTDGVQTPPGGGLPREFPRDGSGRFAYFMRSVP